MSLSVKAGSTSQSKDIFIQDSSSTTGAGLTGLVFNTASLVAYYTFAGPDATAVAITLATLAAVTSAWSSGGFKEISAANLPGVYRLDIPDAALAAAKGRSVVIMLKGATNMAPCVVEIELTGWDNQDGVRGGMTALPNAAAEAAGGLYTRGAGAGQLSQSANGELGVATLAKTLTTYTGNTPQTGDAYARIGAAGAGLTALGDARIANLDAAVSSRSTYAGGDTSGVTTLLARLSATRAGYLDNLSAGAVALEASLQALITTVGVAGAGLSAADDAVLAAIAALNNLSQANVRTAVGLASANLDTQLAAIAGYIDTEVAAIKAKTDALPSDPADASDIAASFSALAATLATIAGYIDTEVAAIKLKTDLIPAAPAAVGDIPTAVQNADAWLKRDMSAVTGEAARSPINALRFSRNKFTIAGGTLTVFKEDDTTPAWTAAITQTAGDPVSASDPA